MTTTAFPLHTLTDQDAHPHALEWRQETLLLDGLAVTIRITDADLHLVTEAGTYRVEASVFWHAFAGAEPTAAEAGLLLADSLMRAQALQQMCQIQIAFEHAYSQIQDLSAVPLPTYRDPLVQRVLAAYDGKPETTHLLARILKQDPAIIVKWAEQWSQAGEDRSESVCTSDPVAPRVSENGHQAIVLPSVQPSVDVQEPPVQRASRTQFTSEQVERIRAAYEQATSVKDMIAELAAEFGYPEHAIRCKLYSLHLPKKRNTGPHRREEASPPATQESDRSGQGECERA